MDLTNKTLLELKQLAKEKGIKNISKYKKDELIELLNNNISDNQEDSETKEKSNSIENTGYTVNNDGDQVVEGILEVMQDGYGFLRGDNYLSSPKDVYVSPIQIRRFRLDTGDKIKGICRMPKETEKFPALIFVGDVNGDSPEMSAKRRRFDDLTPLYPNKRIKLETHAKEFSMRLIDLIAPIGKGQRQLIIGDKKTGKTQLCLDTIANQLNKDMICIYVAIGKTKKEVKEIYYELLKHNAMDYTIIITAFYDDLPSILTLTPYYALSVADYYMKNGYDVLVVLDDLKKHADAYRQISLISGKSPGRDAYPSDIFYFHSRLLERGCQYKDGGSITILPIMETKSGDITDYISTNIISITDGQIVLSRDSFVKGEKPAINYGLSVSRLGGAVQEKDMKELGADIRRVLLSYLETRDVYELANEDEMSKELQEKLFKGKSILNALMQYKFSPINKDEIISRFKPFLEEQQVSTKEEPEGLEQPIQEISEEVQNG